MTSKGLHRIAIGLAVVLGLFALVALMATGLSPVLADDPPVYGAPGGPSFPSVVGGDVSVAAITNGDFETGGLTGWSIVNSGSGGWFPYSGTTAPLSGFTISAPPQGTVAATTDQSGPGSHILFQDIALPNCTNTLKFIIYYQNRAGSFATPASLSHLVSPNQQYRADIMKPFAPVDSVAPADILATPFRTLVGDPLSKPPTLFSVDLTPHGGTTVRLRFAQVDNQFFFQASVDAVTLVSVCNLLETKLDKLETKADRLEGKADRLEAKVDQGVMPGIGRLEGKADRLEAKIDQGVMPGMGRLEGKADRLEAKAEGIMGGVGKLEGKADRLEAKIDKGVMPGIAMLEGKADRLESKAEGIMGGIGKLEGKADRLEGKLDAHEGVTLGITTKFLELVSRLESKLDGLAKGLAAHDANLRMRADAIDAAIAKLEGKADKVEAKVERLQKTLDELSKFVKCLPSSRSVVPPQERLALGCPPG